MGGVHSPSSSSSPPTTRRPRHRSQHFGPAGGRVHRGRSAPSRRRPSSSSGTRSFLVLARPEATGSRPRELGPLMAPIPVGGRHLIRGAWRGRKGLRAIESVDFVWQGNYGSPVGACPPDTAMENSRDTTETTSTTPPSRPRRPRHASRVTCRRLHSRQRARSKRRHTFAPASGCEDKIRELSPTRSGLSRAPARVERAGRPIPRLTQPHSFRAPRPRKRGLEGSQREFERELSLACFRQDICAIKRGASGLTRSGPTFGDRSHSTSVDSGDRHHQSNHSRSRPITVGIAPTTIQTARITPGLDQSLPPAPRMTPAERPRPGLLRSRPIAPPVRRMAAVPRRTIRIAPRLHRPRVNDTTKCIAGTP